MVLSFMKGAKGAIGLNNPISRFVININHSNN